MKVGHLVRFKNEASNIWFIGMLVEWNTNIKEAVIMYNDEILSIPLSRVQRYGKRYFKASRSG